MRKIMVFQHVAHELLGTLNPMLKAAGFRIRYVNFGRHPDFVPSLEGYNGLVILGGPMGVYESAHYPHIQVELKLIEQALKMDIPILGICLGSQMLAHVLGSNVRKADSMELGWHKVHLHEPGSADPLFGAWAKSESIFQLHQDAFEPPRDTHHLAWSDLCPGQAFRYGTKAYGFQFHLEVDKAMIHRWLTIPANKKFLTEGGGLFSGEQVVRETEQHMARSLALSQQTFAKFIEIFQLPERPELLGSDHGKPRRK
ncbi:MAG: type 1 glutamine amidotransferase [Bdellovibrionales bacterium]|nr:type 1 glutamine amidotransferase [Bdellovibrionales bacterium]